LGSQDWVPAGIDTERPSAARIYDYWLGGAHNFEVLVSTGLRGRPDSIDDPYRDNPEHSSVYAGVGRKR
jgi:hypothetical protein